jgi:hypothetical protein
LNLLSLQDEAELRLLSQFTLRVIFVGINCFEMAEGIRSVHRQFPEHILPPLNDTSTDEPPYYVQPFDVTHSLLTNDTAIREKVLLNFRPHTDPTGMRHKLWKEICTEQQQQHYPFFICYGKSDGVNISSLPAVYRRNRQYPLWLSPRGLGLDCHRTWEALYLDAIPIVWHSTLDPLYENLPVIVIDDVSELSETFLRQKLHEIAAKKVQQPAVYQYEKLRNAYWRDLILAKSRHASNNSYTHRNRCWKARTIA